MEKVIGFFIKTLPMLMWVFVLALHDAEIVSFEEAVLECFGLFLFAAFIYHEIPPLDSKE